jgi:hypothetical protein
VGLSVGGWVTTGLDGIVGSPTGIPPGNISSSAKSATQTALTAIIPNFLITFLTWRNQIALPIIAYLFPKWKPLFFLATSAPL